MHSTQRVKKIIIISIVLILPVLLIFSQFKTYFIYKDHWYNLAINNATDRKIEPFNALKEIDQSQVHRVLLTTLEKSRLASLLYVGDKYEFNDVEISLTYNQEYSIKDKYNGFKILFTIGDYDSIVVLSAVNFGEKDFDILDKFASTFTVKTLIRKMTGKIEKKVEAIKNEVVEYSRIEKEYNNFLDELRKIKKSKIFEKLRKYIELNFQLEMNKRITEDWVNPANLYYYKKGDHKSFAFFYYYTLKHLGFKVRSYLVSELIKKDKSEIDKMYRLFSKKKKTTDDLARIQKLEREYKYLNPSRNLKHFLYDYKKKNYTKPSAIFFFYPPDFQSSIFLISVEIDNKWLYTTGNHWIDAGIYKPERTCAHYARNGCYYSYIEKDFMILNNQVISEKDILWDVFYNVK